MSYVLAIAFSILLSAIYAYENAGHIFVKFLMFEGQFPQGVWEAFLFSGGILLMGIFSLLASFESWSRHKTAIKERDKKIASLEEERKTLIDALGRFSPLPAETPVTPPEVEREIEPAA
ncbi:MAG: LapA family protein, partial [Synergistaceae bacterium]|nr:LapA family protein [Synergistaceae bacterium]